MKLNIYSIKDKKGSYANPYVLNNDEQAIRDLKMAVNDERSGMINKFSEDFELTKLGQFDTETGEITSKVEMIINASQLKDLKTIIKQQTKAKD